MVWDDYDTGMKVTPTGNGEEVEIYITDDPMFGEKDSGMTRYLSLEKARGLGLALLAMTDQVERPFAEYVQDLGQAWRAMGNSFVETISKGLAEIQKNQKSNDSSGDDDV